ncbi:MAG: hypothetical protein KDB14_13080 [Planctomycetales bacterium]|nr:hypothetical protein [Planctomycetales bacterium]
MAGAGAEVPPQPQDEQPLLAQPQAEAQPLLQPLLAQPQLEPQPLEAHPQLEAHPLSQPQAGSQQEVLQHFFLQLKRRASRPFFLQQQVVVQPLSQPQLGAAQLLQPLSQPQEAAPQQPFEAQLLQPFEAQPQALSQPQEAAPQQPFEAQLLSHPHAGSQQVDLQHLRARRRANNPHFGLQQVLQPVSHPQEGAALQQPDAQPLLQLLAQLLQPVSQPQLGAEQQLGAGSQQPLLPSIRPSRSCPKLCWAHRPMPSTTVLAKMFHFIEPHLLYVELLR